MANKLGKQYMDMHIKTKKTEEIGERKKNSCSSRYIKQYDECRYTLTQYEKRKKGKKASR